MINFFQLAPNDQSIIYLGMLFGQVGNIIQGGSSLFSAMFKTFNSVILVVAVFVVIYTVIVGLIATANEGEYLGKKFHGLWTPIRIVIGIAALVPTPTGYCSLQILLMWVLVQGIGAADYLWTTSLQYIQSTGTPYTVPTTPVLGASATLSQLFEGLVCAQTAGVGNGMLTWPTGFNGFYCAANPSCGGGSTPTCGPNGCTISFGPGGSCGTLTYCNPALCGDPNSVACAACQAQGKALTSSIIPTLTLIAGKLASADSQYLTFYQLSTSNPDIGQQYQWITQYCQDNNLTPCCVSNPANATMSKCKNTSGPSAFPDPYSNPNIPTDATSQEINQLIVPYFENGIFKNNNFIQTASAEYVSQITSAVQPLIQQLQSKQAGTQLSGKLQEAQSFGWVFAGAYYYFIAQQNNSNLAGANPTFTFAGGAPGSDPSSILANYRNNFVAASILLGGMGGASANAQLSAMNAALYSTEGGILDSFMNTVSGSNQGSVGSTQPTVDPLVSLQGLGEGILLACEILYVVVLVLALVLAGISIAGSFTALGTGVTQGLYPILSVVNSWVAPVFLGFLGAFMSIGALLGVYTPLIPYIIFITGAIGWFGSTIEVMVAAPLLALGILSPSAHHHEILGKAEPGLMMMLGIFLRPSLMIFGLFGGMLLSIIAVTIINSTFSAVMQSITSSQFGGGTSNTAQGSGKVDLLELIFFMIAYVFLVISALNKCFAMIHIIPTRVMRWIGGQAEDFGEGEVLGEVKGGIGGGAGQASSAAGGGARMPGAARSAGKEATKEAESFKQQAPPKFSGGGEGGS